MTSLCRHLSEQEIVNWVTTADGCVLGISIDQQIFCSAREFWESTILSYVCVCFMNFRIQYMPGLIATTRTTRMVQLPATAAIEYVAACWVSGTGEIFVRGCFCPGGLCPFPQVQCVYEPSRLSVPINVAWRTNKKNRRTRPRSSAGGRPPLPKFSGYVEVEAHYIFHPSTIWVPPLFTEGRKKPKKPILPWSKRMSP